MFTYISASVMMRQALALSFMHVCFQIYLLACAHRHLQSTLCCQIAMYTQLLQCTLAILASIIELNSHVRPRVADGKYCDLCRTHYFIYE